MGEAETKYIPKAIQLYERAIEKGNVDAIYDLGFISKLLHIFAVSGPYLCLMMN